jgi:hypothetical protein
VPAWIHRLPAFLKAKAPTIWPGLEIICGDATIAKEQSAVSKSWFPFGAMIDRNRAASLPDVATLDEV